MSSNDLVKGETTPMTPREGGREEGQGARGTVILPMPMHVVCVRCLALELRVRCDRVATPGRRGVQQLGRGVGLLTDGSRRLQCRRDSAGLPCMLGLRLWAAAHCTVQHDVLGCVSPCLTRVRWV